MNDGVGCYKTNEMERKIKVKKSLLSGPPKMLLLLKKMKKKKKRRRSAMGREGEGKCPIEN